MLKQYVVDESMGTRRTLVRDTGRELKVRILLDGLDGGPEATHSHQPGSKVRPHYHLGAQFQLVVRGKAAYPTFQVEAIGVHYTDHNTPYGPFETTEDYQMFVLHAKPAGQLYMDTPENRAKANHEGREIARSASEVPWAGMGLLGLLGLREKVLIAEPTGLRAEVIEAPAGAKVPFGAAEYGRYEIVVAGSALASGTALTAYNLRYSEGTEPAPAIEAGPDGLTLVMLQFDEDASKSHGGSITDRLLEIEAEAPA